MLRLPGEAVKLKFVGVTTVYTTALLAFWLGPTSTTKGPVLAPVGIVMLIDPSLHVFTGAISPFNRTTLLPCNPPNPLPVIVAGLPTIPVFGLTPVITGAGVPAALTETLSNVAVASAPLLLLLTAKPIYTPLAMLIVWLVPSCTQFTPSAETYPLNTFPLRTTFTQYGSVTAAPLPCDVVFPPVLTRSSKYICPPPPNVSYTFVAPPPSVSRIITPADAELAPPPKLNTRATIVPSPCKG